MILSTGIIYAFLESTIEGKIVLLILFIGSIFSWSVMITKFHTLNLAHRQSEKFIILFHKKDDPLKIFESCVIFEGSPLFDIYQAACQELYYHLFGHREIDENDFTQSTNEKFITTKQMRTIQSAIESAVGESSLKLEEQMIILSTAVSGAPFVGLLGTVWGVMDAFGGIAASGSANLAAMAPGVSGALITTVTGLLVAIPAMFGYNFLVTSLRRMIVKADNFAAELCSMIEYRFVKNNK